MPYDAILKQLRIAIQQFHSTPKSRPFITLTFAQTLDGSLALEKEQPISLSGPESFGLTHNLRAIHSGILVGIKTVLIDDPRLNVRLCQGPNPRPIVLDSQMRTPPHSRLFLNGVKPIIAWTTHHQQNISREQMHRTRELRNQAEILSYDVGNLNRQVPLNNLMISLKTREIHSVMVEGGGEVISSFLKEALADFIIITLDPTSVSRQNAPQYHNPHQHNLKLSNLETFALGKNIIITGKPIWSAENHQNNNVMPHEARP